MGQHIIKLDGQYLIWSTVVDAPITYGMTLAELREWIRIEHGRAGLRLLPRRLAHVAERGTSSMIEKSVDDVIAHNRAGPDERTLTRAELIRTYCRQNGETERRTR